MWRCILTILWVAREAEKEEAMEPSCSQTTEKISKPKVTSFFSSMKSEGYPAYQDPNCKRKCIWKKRVPKKRQVPKDPNGIEGVTGEFIVCLARVAKETQKDKNQCYYWSSMDHFICECPLVKASRSATHLNWMEGITPEKGAQIPQIKATKPKVPPGRDV